jgi:hypothetical protein
LPFINKIVSLFCALDEKAKTTNVIVKNRLRIITIII